MSRRKIALSREKLIHCLTQTEMLRSDDKLGNNEPITFDGRRRAKKEAPSLQRADARKVKHDIHQKAKKAFTKLCDVKYWHT